jgi:hypothetical protein
MPPRSAQLQRLGLTVLAMLPGVLLAWSWPAWWSRLLATVWLLLVAVFATDSHRRGYLLALCLLLLAGLAMSWCAGS